MTTAPQPDTDNEAAEEERLRAGVAHVADVVRQLILAELQRGEHPTDAMTAASAFIDQWLQAMTRQRFESTHRYAARIERALAPAVSRSGADAVWMWLMTPNNGLAGGRTPLRQLAEHEVDAVARTAWHDFRLDEPAARAASRTGAGSAPKYPRLTLDDYHRLVESGLLGKTEFIDSHITYGGHDLVLGPEQQRYAETLGIRVWGCVEAVLADERLRAQAVAALREELGGGPGGHAVPGADDPKDATA